MAGAPLSNDIVSCQLRDASRSDYAVPFSETEFARLQSIFPQGVCDWAQGDRFRSGYFGTWHSYGPAQPPDRVQAVP